jgi:hypothetical protein
MRRTPRPVDPVLPRPARHADNVQIGGVHKWLRMYEVNAPSRQRLRYNLSMLIDARSKPLGSQRPQRDVLLSHLLIVSLDRAKLKR